jgi:hypothetical protein
VFTSHGTGKYAVLSVYIEAEGSPFGPVEKNPKFPAITNDQFPEVVYRPVPAGFDVAVTIRHEYIRDKFFLERLNASLPKVLVPSNPFALEPAAIDVRKDEDGFTFHVRLKIEYKQLVERTIRIPWTPAAVHDYGDKLWGNLITTPLTLRVKDGQATWSLDYWQRKIRWSTMLTMGMQRNRNEQGALDAHAHVNQVTWCPRRRDRRRGLFWGLMCPHLWNHPCMV